MILYEEDEFLQLSGVQHFAFCRRQWALAYIELQWQENVRTVEGHLLHEKAHDGSIMEKRGDLIVSRAMPVHSREMGIYYFSKCMFFTPIHLFIWIQFLKHP